MARNYVSIEDRLKKNREIDLLVENYIKDKECLECRGIGHFKHLKRGSYLVRCLICKVKYHLKEKINAI